MTQRDESASRLREGEPIDDDTVVYALKGMAAWGGLAISRALLVDGKRDGDPLYGKLLDAQRAITELKKQWR